MGTRSRGQWWRMKNGPHNTFKPFKGKIYVHIPRSLQPIAKKVKCGRKGSG